MSETSRIEKFVEELLKKYEQWESEEPDWNKKRFYAGARLALREVLKKIRKSAMAKSSKTTKLNY